VLYGAFGTVLQRTVCDPSCSGAASCTRRETCVYAQLFEPSAPDLRFGSKDGRKAFLFRPPLDVASEFGPLRPLHFELRLFGNAIDAAGLFINSFRQLATTGLANRATILVSVLSLDWTGTSARILYEDGHTTDALPIILSLEPLMAERVVRDRVQVTFDTPTCLKEAGVLQRQPSLSALIRRLRDRISLLSLMWEGKEWNAEYRAIGEIAEVSTMHMENGGWGVHNRHSTRTRRDMPVEGFRGTISYEHVDPVLMPLLWIGQEIHVGQHVVWGNGRYRIET
jgi:hypothetical protein